jgi:hypothetical protein
MSGLSGLEALALGVFCGIAFTGTWFSVFSPYASLTIIRVAQ